MSTPERVLPCRAAFPEYSSSYPASTHCTHGALSWLRGESEWSVGSHSHTGPTHRNLTLNYHGRKRVSLGNMEATLGGHTGPHMAKRPKGSQKSKARARGPRPRTQKGARGPPPRARDPTGSRNGNLRQESGTQDQNPNSRIQRRPGPGPRGSQGPRYTAWPQIIGPRQPEPCIHVGNPTRALTGPSLITPRRHTRSCVSTCAADYITIPGSHRNPWP